VIPSACGVLEDDADDVSVDGLASFPGGMAEAGGCEAIEVTKCTARGLVQEGDAVSREELPVAARASRRTARYSPVSSGVSGSMVRRRESRE